MPKNIPFFNYQSLFEHHKDELTKIFQDVASRGAFIMQDDLSDFEANLAEYTKSKFALGVANATDAMQKSPGRSAVGI